MPITHTSRTGKTYYLHTGPKRGGGTQHFLSTKAAGPLAKALPEGFEIHEAVNSQVFLRRQQPKLIREAELDCLRHPLAQPRAGHRYQVEASGKIITVHESGSDLGLLREVASHLSAQEQERISVQFAQLPAGDALHAGGCGAAVVRPGALLLPRRRGRLDFHWPPPAPLEKLASQYLKHLGRDSLYELF